MPEQVTMLRDFMEDSRRESKPILDEYQFEEFERDMLFSMEYVVPLKLKVWREGIFSDYKGLLHRLDEKSRNVYLEVENRGIVRINFNEIVGVEVEDI
nr:YolD-like family protein [Bacillus sp. ISL-55]